MTKLTGQEIADEGLQGWVNLGGFLQTRIRTADFATGLAVVNLIAAAADDLDQHPQLDLRYNHVDVRLTDSDGFGVTERHVRLAKVITAIARGAGVETESDQVSRLEIALDTPHHADVLPFWKAVLSMKDLAAIGVDDEIRDPRGVLPPIWFQSSGGDEPRQRWHFDVFVDPAAVRPLIDAALASGGTLVSEVEAPSFWVLADPDGNQVCLCTWQGRD